MITLKRSREEIRARYRRAFQASGFNTSDSIVSELIEALVGAIETDYTNVYALENNVRLDTASDSFLDSYGVWLDEPRQSTSFAQVNDLRTISIFLRDSNGRTLPGVAVTTTGNGIPIERGTALLDADNRVIMRTTQTVELVGEKVYVKAVAVDPTVTFIPANTIKTLQLDLASNQDIDQGLLGSFFLGADNERDIVNQAVSADTNTYRFILQEKAASVNLSNDRKINTVFDNLKVRNFKLRRLNPGSTSMTLYVETINVETDSLVLTELQQQLLNIMPEGTDIRVRPFVYSTLSASFRISASANVDGDTAREFFKELFITAVNTAPSGVQINFDTLVRNIITSRQDIRAAEFDSLLINGRSLANNVYRANEIERVFAYPNTVSYKV